MNTYPNDAPVQVVLSRRNILALLAKLDGHPAGSSLSISKGRTMITAQEDAEHYGNRTPGPMHPDTEAHISGPQPSQGILR